MLLQVSLLEELLSPLLTPLFLLFWFRPRALEIIDFFHHFTVDVAGVGDICSFALMDVKRHGHPQVRVLPWLFWAGPASSEQTQAKTQLIVPPRVTLGRSFHFSCTQSV